MEIVLIQVFFHHSVRTQQLINIYQNRQYDSTTGFAQFTNTRVSMIYRLSFSMPPHLLTTLANGLIMGKNMAFSPVNIPTRLNMDDHYQGYIGVTKDINKAIKATARTNTKSRLSDKIRFEAVASITAVTVWKTEKFMDPLGQRIF